MRCLAIIRMNFNHQNKESMLIATFIDINKNEILCTPLTLEEKRFSKKYCLGRMRSFPLPEGNDNDKNLGESFAWRMSKKCLIFDSQMHFSVI